MPRRRRDFKDVKEKDAKEFKDKEKDSKEVEQKCCKEKDYPEHKCYPPHDKWRDYEELVHRIGRIVERIERIEDEARRRPFIRGEERPDVGERALRTDEGERHDVENERARHEEERRRHEQERLHEEERHRQEAERLGAQALTTPHAAARPEPPRQPKQAERKKR